jgi:hypothetical protein
MVKGPPRAAIFSFPEPVLTRIEKVWQLKDAELGSWSEEEAFFSELSLFSCGTNPKKCITA